MQLINLLTTLTLLSTITALPSHSKRDTLGVYVCSSTKWTGICTHIIPTAAKDPKGDCLPIPYSGTQLWMSFGPDKGLKCATYTKPECKGDRMATNYPGNGVFAGYGAQGGSISFRCVPEMTPIGVDTNGEGDPYSGPKKDLG